MPPPLRTRTIRLPFPTLAATLRALPTSSASPVSRGSALSPADAPTVRVAQRPGAKPADCFLGRVAGTPRPGRYRPALDGLRAVAVVAVVLCHAGVGWLPGGWLGVDAFFVLSGYLITTLLLAEHASTGRIRFGAFWARRARRLLPALLTVVTAVLAGARWLLPPEELAPLGADALATLGYVANWRMIDRGDGYATLTAAPSPLQHTWSLALEEQFYLLWPLLVGAATTVWFGRSAGRALRLGAAGAAGASALTMALVYAPDTEPARAYYGSDTRAFGLLAGCALALGLALRNERSAQSHRYRPTHAVSHRWPPLAVAALGSAIGLGWALGALDDAEPALYRGGLLLVVVAVGVVIAQIERAPACLAGRALARWPLPQLGRISYEVYLWHWPVFVAVDHDRTSLTGGTLLVVRCVVALLLASLTYRLISRPVRTGRWPRLGRLRPAAAAVGAVGAVAIAAVVLTGPAGPGTAPTPNGTAGAGVPVPVAGSALLNRPGRAPGPARITIFGDSVAYSLGVALPALPGTTLTNRALIGCGIARSGVVRNAGRIQRPYARCPQWDRYWTDGVKADRPDVAVVVLARWEVLDRRYGGRWQHIGQPEYDAYLRRELARMIAVLTADGARVVLARAPYNRRYERRDGSAYPEDDPARMDAWNRMLADTARAHRTRVRILDLGGRLCPDGRYTRDVDGVRLRSDGLHLTAGGVRDWVGPWLLPRLALALR